MEPGPQHDRLPKHLGRGDLRTDALPDRIEEGLERSRPRRSVVADPELTAAAWVMLIATTVPVMDGLIMMRFSGCATGCPRDPSGSSCVLGPRLVLLIFERFAG